MLLATLAALVVVSVSVAQSPKSPGPAEARSPRAFVAHNAGAAGGSRRRLLRRNVGGARHPYWALERKYVAQGHALGHANAEVRRLRRQVAVRRLQERLSAAATIRLVFGPTYGDGAVRVATCESRLDPGARNGQYHGVLQMGTNERRTYGDSDTVLGQALAAYRYFAATGYDWSPWDCKP